MRYFDEKEFIHAKTMDPMLRTMLDHMRHLYGKPIIITSSYRKASDTRTSAHQIGPNGFWQAVDIRCDASGPRFGMVSAAMLAGFRRIGVYDQHIHVDVADEGFDPDVLWIGKSK